MRFDDLYQAEQHLATLCAANHEPKVEPHELRDFVVGARTVDADGRRINDSSYQLTVDLNLAAANAWGLKAAKASSMFDFSSDNQRFNQSQVMGHCMKMVRHYQSRQIATWKTNYNSFSRNLYSREVAE